MTNNTKQGLIVIGISFALMIAIVAPKLVRGLGQDRKVGLMSVRDSMEKSYSDLVGSRTNVLAQRTSLISALDLRAMFCDTNSGTLKFTSYAPPETIFLAREPVEIRSQMLMCVIEGYDSCYGIDANGGFRKISKEEFANWPHVSAQELQGATATNK